MQMRIHKLPPHVADLIAAGEVVERPASVVKELTENAVDAGAKHVTVEVKNGGMSFIRVTDDGCGMHPEDAKTAFLRHATSKIRGAEDLGAIKTLGFRGEALAATAAVSRVELLTKTEENDLGVSLRLEAGNVTSQEEAGCPKGTTIIVRDLFFNTPARMKFMKRDSVESSAILSALQKQALANPSVAFRYIRDGEEELATSGDGDLYAAVYAVYGRQFAKEMTEVSGKWDSCRLSGFVTNPTNTRGNRNYQQFFVNGRYVKSRLLSAALEEAYRNQIMVGRFPGCVLMLTLPEGDVDVNVHPAKTEVKFLSEQTVFDCVRYVVRGALSKAPARPEVVLSAPKAASVTPAPAPVKIPAAPQKTATPAQKAGFRTMTAEEFRTFATVLEKGRPVTPSDKLMQDVFFKEKEEAPAAQQISIPLPEEKPVMPPPAPVVEVKAAAPGKKEEQASYRIIGEALNSYIIVEQAEELLFIDKHAAHERILFEKLKNLPTKVMSQTLLAPVTASLSPEEQAIVLENTAYLQDFGFELEDFGDAVLIRAVPCDILQEDASALLSQLANDLLEGRGATASEKRETLLHSVACKAAIKAGWHTTAKELEILTHEVMTRDDLRYCPHGRPICIRLTDAQLQKFFKRT